MRVRPKASGWVMKTTAVALVAACSLTLAGQAFAARDDRAAASSARRMAQLATNLSRINLKMATGGATMGPLRAMQEARSAYIALRAQLRGKLPAGATPEARTARDVLATLTETYIKQNAEGLARLRMSPTGRVRAFCNLKHEVRSVIVVEQLDLRFDRAVRVLGSQAQVAIPRRSGPSISARVRRDRSRTAATGLCVLTAVRALVPAVTRAFSNNARGEAATLTSVTTHALDGAFAFLLEQKPPKGSPFLAVWRAQVAYAITERTVYSGLTEQFKTGRIANRAAFNLAQRALPGVVATLEREERAAGFVP